MVHVLRPGLVIVDSLSAINLKGENNVEDVRGLLGFLSAVAREFDIALLLVHHLRKRGQLAASGPVTHDDFRGSSHIVAMARSVLALSIVQTGPAPDLNGPRRLEVVKTNLCAHPAPLGIIFELGELGLDQERSDAYAGGTLGARGPTLRYTGPPQPYREPTQTAACGEWLVDLLANASTPLRPKTVLQAAGDAGFSRATLYRARKELGDLVVDVGRGPRDPHKRWALAQEAG
jgi:hypothetical protein